MDCSTSCIDLESNKLGDSAMKTVSGNAKDVRPGSVRRTAELCHVNYLICGV